MLAMEETFDFYLFQAAAAEEEQQTIYGEADLLWSYSPELPPVDLAAFFPDVHLADQQEDMIMAVDVPEAEVAPAATPVIHRSAFGRYTGSLPENIRRLHNLPRSGLQAGGEIHGRNIHRRVIDMVRRIPRSLPAAPPQSASTAQQEVTDRSMEKSREYRHMMRERQRREKLSQSYADLYAMVSSRSSKSDKNSIVQSAYAYIHELKGCKESLQKRNEELKEMILGSNDSTSGVAKIKIRAANPNAPLDSMIHALRCLQQLDVKAKTIRADLSSSNFSAVAWVDTKMATADVERFVEEALMEEEKKIQWNFPATATTPWS